MATKFTEKEITDIRAKLFEAAGKFASTLGMRKTTVDDLCAHAGISKGAFYKFYDSKEALFFEILELWHTRIYGKALEIITNADGTTDRTLILSFSDRDHIGPLYHEMMEFMVMSVCEQVVE